MKKMLVKFVVVVVMLSMGFLSYDNLIESRSSGFNAARGMGSYVMRGRRRLRTPVLIRFNAARGMGSYVIVFLSNRRNTEPETQF